MAAMLGDDSDVADDGVAVVAAGDAEADQIPSTGVGHPPPVAWAWLPAQVVQGFLGGRVQPGPGDGSARVRVETALVDPAEDVEDRGIIGLGPKLETIRTLGHPAVRRPSVSVTLDKR